MSDETISRDCDLSLLDLVVINNDIVIPDDFVAFVDNGGFNYED